MQTVKSITQVDTCFSESPKRRKDSEGDLITPDVGLATTNFFKSLVNQKKNENKSTTKLNNLDPIQKKEMYKKLSKK